MAVDKILEVVYDLTSINQDQLNQLVKANEDIIKKAEKQNQKRKNKKKKTTTTDFVNPDNRTISEKTTDPLLTPKTEQQSGLRKIFGKNTFNNLVNFGSSPFSFIQGTVLKLIPLIGTALLVTGVIAAFLKQVDDFQKQFVDNVDKRINLFREKETQARVQAGLQQLIITSESGSAEPRDAYNTFNEFNTNQSRIESDFKIRDSSGVD